MGCQSSSKRRIEFRLADCGAKNQLENCCGAKWWWW